MVVQLEEVICYLLKETGLALLLTGLYCYFMCLPIGFFTVLPLVSSSISFLLELSLKFCPKKWLPGSFKLKAFILVTTTSAKSIGPSVTEELARVADQKLTSYQVSSETRSGFKLPFNTEKRCSINLL